MSLFLDVSKYQLNLCVGACILNTCVYVYAEKEQTDGKLTLFETLVIKIIDGLSNSSELRTNIAPKSSYLGPNNIHKWIQVANWCSTMLQAMISRTRTLQLCEKRSTDLVLLGLH